VGQPRKGRQAGSLRAFAGPREAQENDVQAAQALAYEAFVLAHQKLSLDLTQRIQHDTDDND
jgi:hypothetical protein